MEIGKAYDPIKGSIVSFSEYKDNKKHGYEQNTSSILNLIVQESFYKNDN